MASVRSAVIAMILFVAADISATPAGIAAPEVEMDQDLRSLVEEANLDVNGLLEAQGATRDLQQEVTMTPTASPTMAPSADPDMERSTPSASSSNRVGPTFSAAFATIAGVAALLSGAAAMPMI